MGTPFIGLSLTLALIFGSGGGVSAGPFDRAAASYGPALNEALERAGSELRFDLERCETAPLWECRFSSTHIAVVVAGGRHQTGIAKITIAADLPAALPHAAVLDALIALTATMIVFDPDLPPEQRNGMVSSLAESVHHAGHGEEHGIAADYDIGLHRTTGTLLVITATPKP